MNFGFNPVYRKRDQPHSVFRVKPFHGFHQAHIAFLNQVCLGETVSGVTTGDVYHKAQVGHNQATSGFKVILVMQTVSQFTFFFDRQNRNRVDRLNISLPGSDPVPAY